MTAESLVDGFEYDGFWVRVEAHADDLEWLDEFLCPQFQRVDPSRAPCSVRLVRDADRFASLAAGRPLTGGTAIDCFALDQQVIRLPAWPADGGGAHIHDEKFHTVYVLTGDPPRVDIVSSIKRRGPRIPGMRVIREFAMNHSLGRGRLFIHGAAIALDGSGILIAGPSTSGKTTLLMHLLAVEGAEYVSNDRVLVRQEGGETILHGMPAITTLRTTTLDFHPVIRDALSRSRFNHQRTVRESERAAIPARAWEDGRYGLTPAQFCLLLGVSARAVAPARALLLPRKTDRPGGITLRQLPPDEVQQRLESAIFGIGCWSRAANVFALDADRAVTPAEELRTRCRHFAASIPAFECQLGRQAYEDPEATRALLAGLPG